MRINILKKGDKVIGFSGNIIAIQRKNGEVDMIRVIEDDNGVIRVDPEHKVTIGFGNGTVSIKDPKTDVEITTF